MWIEVTRRFADSPILPLRPSTYARVLKTETFAKLGEDLASLSDVDDAVQQFKNLLVSTEVWVVLLPLFLPPLPSSKTHIL